MIKKIVSFIVIIFLCFSLFVVYDYSIKKYEINNISVEKGDNIQKILKKENISYYKYEKFFITKYKDKNIYTGNYEINKTLTKKELIDEIYNKKPKNIFLTIPEGMTNEKVFKRIEALGLSTQKEIEKVLENYDFYYTHSKNFEGYFYPATYEFTNDVTAKEIVDKILNEFLKQFPVEKYKDKDKFYNNLILSSIVELETQNKDEVENVAGVFKHRLRIDKRLESDATLRYVLEDNKRASYTDLKNNMSLYNTYRHKGLTPTPVCNPSKHTILTTMNAKENENLYFFARDGKIYYSKTHQEHLNKRNSE